MRFVRVAPREPARGSPAGVVQEQTGVLRRDSRIEHAGEGSDSGLSLGEPQAGTGRAGMAVGRVEVSRPALLRSRPRARGVASVAEPLRCAGSGGPACWRAEAEVLP